jgi:hypothetical protein
MNRQKLTFSKTTFGLFFLFLLLGFTALLHQVVWQRILGLFSDSDIRSITLVVATYLLGLSLGGLRGGCLSNYLGEG